LTMRPPRGRICWRQPLRCSIAMALRAQLSRRSARAGVEWKLPSFLRIEEGTGRRPVSGSPAALSRRHAGSARYTMRGTGRRRPADRAHLDWVTINRREARFLFGISRSEWSDEVRGAQRAENAHLAESIERLRVPLMARRVVADDREPVSQPDHRTGADLLPRLLSGRDHTDPQEQSEALIACAIRAVVAPGAAEHNGAKP